MFTQKIEDEFEVFVTDLSLNSHVNIDVLCDYCKENITTIQYKTYNIQNKKSIIKKDCCKSCWGEKLKESMLEKYLFSNASEVKDIQDKRLQTFKENYGTSNPMKVESIKNKAIETNIRKYGIKNLMQIKEIQIQRSEKRSVTMFNNNSTISSKQQRHLNNILGGVLNYPCKGCFLDIAFPEEMIYIEYDGSGHDLDVVIGAISKKQKQIKEIKRYYSLKKEGWKMIKILSKNDFLPNDEKIIKVINLCKDILINNNNCVIDIDNGIIKLKNEIIIHDFGTLNKIKNNN